MAARTVRVVSTGMWVPERVLSNADLEEMVDTSNEWIVERTGIHERRIASEVGVVDMGGHSGAAALEEAGIDADAVDVLIVSTATPDRLLPATACDIQARLGADRAVAFDVIGACSGWLYALHLARGLIVSGQAETALCVATERMSSIIDWTDRSICVLFGDASGAAVLQGTTEADRGIIATHMASDGKLAELLYRGPASSQRNDLAAAAGGVAATDGNLVMAGREVFKAAVRSMAESVDAVLERGGVTKDDIDLLIPHQANIRIIEATARYAGVPMERVWVNIDRYGNTSSATIPVALHEAREAGRLTDGSLVLMVAFGAGLTWAATLLRL